MSVKFFKMSNLLEELLYGKKKETARATKVEDADVHHEDEADDVKDDGHDAVEKVVKKKRIKRKD